MLDGPKIWEFLMWVVPLVVGVIQAVRQPIVEDVIHRSVDALCDFVSGELGRWRFAHQKKSQIEEELKTQIKEVEAENEVLKEKNRAMEKQVVDLQKIEEDLKTKVKEVEAENEMRSKRNEKMQKKVVDLQKIEEQLKIEKNYIIEVAAKNEVQLKKNIDDLVAKNEVLDKKVVDLQKIEEELKSKIDEAGAENKVLWEKDEAAKKKMVDLQKIEVELKTEIKEARVENKVLREKNEALEKKQVQSPVPLSDHYQGSFGGQILSLTFEGKLGIIKSNIGDEGGIPLGPWGGHGGSHWAYKVDIAHILQITLRYGPIINSILFTSKSRDGNIIMCSDRFGGHGGEYTATLCIDSSVEQLSSINLTYGDIRGMRLITSLSFYSNRGRYGPYGSSFGSTASIPVSIPVEGAVLAGFHGRCGLYLDAFGVLLAPKVLDSSQQASGSGLRLEEI